MAVALPAARSSSRPLAAPRQPTSGALAIVVGVFAILGAFGALSFVLPAQIGLVLAAGILLAIPWIWQAPVRGLYLVVGGAMMIEILPLRFPDSWTDRLPLFLNFNETGAAYGVGISPMEILLLVMLLVCLVKVGSGALERPAGNVLTAYLIFVAALFVAELVGLATGGDFNISLRELRPQAYGFAAFLLAAMLVRDRRHLVQLGTLVFVAVGTKAALADYRYFVTMARAIGGASWLRESVMSHEESYFYAILLAAFVAMLVWYRSRRRMLAVLPISAITLVAMVENQRRAGIAAMVVMIALVLVIAARHERLLRGRIVAGGSVLVAILGGLSLFYTQSTGAIAQLVRPFRSMIDPSSRDLLSDLYRVAENFNLSYTFHSSPLLGVGFGHPFLVILAQADIASIYPLWNYIPHNTILWIGAKMGVIGFATFFALIGMVVLEGMSQVGTWRDPLLKTAAAVAVAVVVGEIVVGFSDVQLEVYRNMIAFGAAIGVLCALPKVPDAKVPDAKVPVA